MTERKDQCPDCNDNFSPVDRRNFMKTVGATAVAAGAGSLITPATSFAAPPTPRSTAETAVSALYNSLSDEQKRDICFDWDHREEGERSRGLLRTHISNNWQVTQHRLTSRFFTNEQRGIIRDIFRGLFNPEWHTRVERQLREDNGGRPWGSGQSVAIFGRPGTNQFQFVMTGRHMTVRADGNTGQHVAFGGPIFYGHAASGFNERPGHPGNIYWEQARHANFVYRMLDGQQQRRALVQRRPDESAVGFRGRNGEFPGIAVSDLSRDQKEELERVLAKLLEPYRTEDRDDVRQCLQRQGGLDRCHLTFYSESDLGQDEEWDNWRLEGPAFVWYFRGTPHVHVWVNVADDPSVQLNARG